MESAGKKIMVVDDSELNRMMMESFLDPMGHDVVHASNGKEALALIEKIKPDLVLLDVMMPEMDGFEVCKRLKSQETTRFIPVIMITALDKVEDNVKGIESGADDFLTRPFDAVILAARMKALLQSKALNDEVDKLEQLKEDMTRMIVHDLRTPMTSIKMSLELIHANLPQDDSKSTDLLRIASADVEEALLLINNLLDISKLESHKMELHKEDSSVLDLLKENVQRIKPLTVHNHLNLEIVSKNNEIFCELDRILIGRVLTNLLSNAVKFADANTTILIEASQDTTGKVDIGVINQGGNIPKESQEVIFEKFGQSSHTKSKNKLGTGLGLTFCKLVIEAHKGTLCVVSPPAHFPTGAAFYFSLPLR